MAARAKSTAPFRVGQKKLFLPTSTIALIRGTRNLPTEATFNVPLFFSKLDLRDYLYHAYALTTSRIRSYVKQSRVQSGKPNAVGKPIQRRWHRPRAKKYMTVELARPFVWPEEPEDGYKDWGKEDIKLQEEEQKKFQEQRDRLSDTWVNKDRRERMREQAKALLEGKAVWKPSAEEGSKAGVIQTKMQS